ncbi:unnamed protein product [Prorocentrum cordatum]|uniref:Peroxisomal membrane protein PEX16 n=1 Tax=Prorocentrum cordatum TaxID=2364126 RepID=A0ABN9VD35_9DINO|nr:unnamed protein product [Polarella glacialis]
MPVEHMPAAPTAIRAAPKHAQDTAALESAVFFAAHLKADHKAHATTKLSSHYFVQSATRLRQQRRQEISEGRVVEELDRLGGPRPHLRVALAGALKLMGDRVGA